MTIQLVILLLLASFVLVLCAEVPPYDHQEFRRVLNTAVYLDGSGRQVKNLVGFAQWSFKSICFSGECGIAFAARDGAIMSILREKKLNRGSGGLRARILSRDTAIYDVLVLRIPKQHRSVDSFTFAYLVSAKKDIETFPGFFSLQWSKSQAGKKDWVFARFQKEKAGRDEVEYVPIGPRPESFTAYSVRVMDDDIEIYVNSRFKLAKKMPGVGNIPYFRCAGVALNTMPSKNHHAEVLYKSISWSAYWQPRRED